MRDTVDAMPEARSSENGPFFEFVLGIQSLGAQVSKALDRSRPTLQQWTTRIDARLAAARAWVAENGPQIAAVAFALKKLAAGSHVENWSTLDEDQWIRALSLMCADDGVPLAWVPPAPVVEELVDAADHAARDVVLLAHADEIEQQARALLGVVTHDDLGGLRAAGESAWDAWDAGLLIPAQAAAGVIVGEVLLRHGFGAFGDFRKKWEPFRDVPTEEWQLTELRTTALMCALSTAVQREDQGDFRGFNRNVALHRLDEVQYTRANALRALMLVTAAVRELQFDVASEWTSSPGFAMPPAARITPDRLASAGPDLGGRHIAAAGGGSPG